MHSHRHRRRNRHWRSHMQIDQENRLSGRGRVFRKWLSRDPHFFYDDLVLKREPAVRRRRSEVDAKGPATEKVIDRTSKSVNDRTQEAIDLVRETIEALQAERGGSAKLWGSMVKQTLKRRQPGFNESYYGFGSFNDLLEEAQARGQLDLELDDRSGGHVIRAIGRGL
jgi:hypothetical protein